MAEPQRGDWRQQLQGSFDFSVLEAVFLVLTGAGLLIFAVVGPGGAVAGLGAAIPAGLLAGLVIAAARRRRERGGGPN